MAVDVKICGLTDENAVASALGAGADYLGFVFYPRSPRNLSPQTAARLVEPVRADARIVALMVDPCDRLVDEVVDQIAPHFVQLHGSESAQRVAQIKCRTGCQVIKALKIATLTDMAQAAIYRPVADFMLYDAKAPREMVDALPGGNGIAFDWRLLREVQEGDYYMLSGGLDVGNVTQALALTQAPAIDVSSGVECAPGKKDPELIHRFLSTVKDGAQHRDGKATAHA